MPIYKVTVLVTNREVYYIDAADETAAEIAVESGRAPGYVDAVDTEFESTELMD